MKSKNYYKSRIQTFDLILKKLSAKEIHLHQYLLNNYLYVFEKKYLIFIDFTEKN